MNDINKINANFQSTFKSLFETIFVLEEILLEFQEEPIALQQFYEPLFDLNRHLEITLLIYQPQELEIVNYIESQKKFGMKLAKLKQDHKRKLEAVRLSNISRIGATISEIHAWHTSLRTNLPKNQ